MEDKERDVQKLLRKLKTLIYQVDLEEHAHRMLQTILEEQECADLQNVSLSLAECHVVDCIGRDERVNTTGIARKLNITKGGISKITAKLVKKGMVEAYRLANNQKETYYRLTPLGEKIFHLHEVLHQQAEAQFAALFSLYSPEELAFAGRFLDDLTAVFRSQ
ncbi:MAG TPA: MarR family transcriptional regulator [Selenomonadales bacterium]|nr:MarR family transcriptional regulator [Selenomonadales bacterium]